MRPGDEQAELRAAVRSLLARHEGAAAWRPLVEQIGAAGLAVPEEYGGAGRGALETHVVMEELGRVLSPVPYLGSAVLTVRALLASGDRAACADLLPALAAGTSVGALAWAEDGSGDPARIRTEAESGGGPRLTGVKEHVLGGQDADVLLVVARSAAGPSLFAVPVDGPGVTVEPLETMDATRPQARVRLAGARARPVGAGGDGGRVLARALDEAVVALAAEQVGGAARALERTVEHVGNRVQFGRPIGSFQAVKHRLADGYVMVESARSLALAAATASAEDSPRLPLLAAAAGSACAEAFSAVAGEMIQLHGGIGFTWEHDAHRYFKRAHGSGLLLGTPSRHRGRLAAALDLVPGPSRAAVARP
ncbi:acyl-CoA dehydrogenase family protein [Streptomyces sp. GC420]|uniref:acyl-CoA dehydrogenase family protein n=1 Tax=Streptomyces sp. GC420 TaxID=2697568 RepID=UPI001414FCAA|nr:acyl-CoA dehydrogenase family protein [Streptomyces sp. GC420]NBM17900.1 acyl-CoA dehydrogenase [Streptomyces sp. GC420]